ncbi:MAG: DUF1566 domain-containing protein, partial [Methylococcales bacterium]|nr:DUF1566 domain-containing protein [Methylococcales bacterium]
TGSSGGMQRVPLQPINSTPVKPVPTVTIPSVSNPLATPNATTQGNPILFSATLSNVLPSNYSVKVNYGNGLIAMNGSGTNYSVSQIPTQLGLQTFTVGIYDNLNISKSNLPTGTFEIVKSNTAPTLTFNSGATTSTIGATYSVQLSANDIDNNLNVVVMDWGDGASENKTATNGAPLTFTHTYATANTFAWNATAYDSSNANSAAVSKTITISQPVTVENFVSGSKTFSYTKIANDGSVLPITAQLGTGAKDWACTKDNNTGLTWEVKTDDGGLRDKDWYYSWYEPDASKNGGSSGYTDIASLFRKPISCSTEDNCNTYAFINAVNSQTLCGANDWRMPTNVELQGLIYCSDGQYNKLTEESLNSNNGYGLVCSSNRDVLKTTFPTINTTYFPDTKDNYLFWSASFSDDNPRFYGSFVWNVGFASGSNDSSEKDYPYSVRLVRMGQ